jgi:4-carboxymuconolactone decarboxylase
MGPGGLPPSEDALLVARSREPALARLDTSKYRVLCGRNVGRSSHLTFGTRGELTVAENEAFQKGQELRRRLLGDAYVDRVNHATYGDPIMRQFIDVVTETVFGSLWTRPGLDLKTRTLVTLVSDAATGREAELAIHLRMALRQGWAEAELTEALLHLIGYVGAPLARDALLVARAVFAEVREGAEQ